ncbi:MAG: M56 family metallopeptidase [Lachnospiraceae bacterium]|nr:M56 family metallopeptidase [Lachnospiraceae bacterium]
MSVLQMSISGAVLILAVVVLRALTMNRLPKDTFLILWGIVLLRLMVPLSVPSGLSVYSWMEQNMDLALPVQNNAAASMKGHNEAAIDSGAPKQAPRNNTSEIFSTRSKQLQKNDENVISDINTYQAGKTKNTLQPTVSKYQAQNTDSNVIFSMIAANLIAYFNITTTIRFTVWCVGMLVCMTHFIMSYLRCRIEFQTSLPVENPFAQRWIEEHHHRLFTIRQSDKISTPLTYGIRRPVILMPKNTDWENTLQLQYILMHEYIHICRYDALTKLVCTCALCIHWFNPLVWIMYVLFNRDVEISCDEHVVRRFGEASKSVYAKMLIQMEAQRSNVMTFLPLGSGLLLKIGKNAMEERIRAIMKIKNKSISAAVLAAVLVISVTTVFATSAEEKTGKTKTGEDRPENVRVIPDADFTEEDCQKLLALQFEGYRDMSISSYQEKVWTLIDTKEYRDLLERFSKDETLYAIYEGKREADKNTKEMAAFLYNIYDPLTGTKWRTRDFSGYAATDFSDASDNACLEYTVTLTILDADGLTVGEYDIVRQHVMDDLKDIFQTKLGELLTTELRDEEFMRTILNEEINSIKWEWGNERLQIAVAYDYTPLGELPVEAMDDWTQEIVSEWDSMLKPYAPYGLIYQYDQRIDECKMYFNGKEVRAIYDIGQNLFISTHAGIGEGIYAEDAVDLYAEYDGSKLIGLREATPEEMEEATKKRQAVTDAYKDGQEKYFDRLREDVPATEEDYQSLLALKTPDYRSKTIADFNRELLDWANNNFERQERIAVDNMYKDYHAALTDEEKAFAATTAHLSVMENGEYVRSIQRNEPERDVVEDIFLSGKSTEEFGQDSNRSAWCSLYYTFSYHISDKKTVRIGERDDCVGGMIDSIRGFWESSTVDQLVAMTEDEMLEMLHLIAEKYSSRNVTITVLDDKTAFERMDERELYDMREGTVEISFPDYDESMIDAMHSGNHTVFYDKEAVLNMFLEKYNNGEFGAANPKVVLRDEYGTDERSLSGNRAAYKVACTDNHTTLTVYMKRISFDADRDVWQVYQYDIVTKPAS